MVQQNKVYIHNLFGIAHNFWWSVYRIRTLTLERVDVIINGAGNKRSDDEDATFVAAAFLGATNAVVVEIVAAHSAKVTAHREKIIVGVRVVVDGGERNGN